MTSPQLEHPNTPTAHIDKITMCITVRNSLEGGWGKELKDRPLQQCTFFSGSPNPCINYPLGR